jgi:hypothetical protein
MSEGPEFLEYLLAKAEHSFEAAEGLLEDGHAGLRRFARLLRLFIHRRGPAPLQRVKLFPALSGGGAIRPALCED